MTILSPSPGATRDAAAILKTGGVVAFATETVYGLGCDTFNKKSIKQVYAIKGRPLNNPMIAHILDVSWVSKLTDRWNSQCDVLANSFWPGGLTLILPKRADVPMSACGGFETIAIRCPAHPSALDLLSIFGGPISAPSANKSGYVSPTTAQHVDDEFNGDVTVLDGGPCEFGIESTVVSMIDQPTILRLGSVTSSAIGKVLGSVQYCHNSLQSDSPGTSERHYAPKSRAKFASIEEIQSITNEKSAAIIITPISNSACCTYQMPSDPKGYGAKLYAVLREADANNPTEILIEKPPISVGWDAIQDRLARCTACG